MALSHQEHDIPAVTATVVQHDRHLVRCACGVEPRMSVLAVIEHAPLSGSDHRRRG